jgi:SAM-dependent methyltransferase
MQNELWKSEANWFVEWFNCPAYHVLYGNRDSAEADAFIQRLSEVVCPAPPAEVLDLGCGSGRHVRSFEAMGYRAHGIDLSPASIEEAQRLALHPERFAVADMRDFATTEGLNHRFDVITSLFTSFGYFTDWTDQIRTLQQVRVALRPGGTFVLDFLNTPHVTAHLVPHEIAQRRAPDGGIMTFEIHRRIVAGWIEKSIAYQDGQGKPRHYVERVRALSLMDLEALLAEADLTVHRRFGDYGLGAHSDASNRCILVAS